MGLCRFQLIIAESSKRLERRLVGGDDESGSWVILKNQYLAFGTVKQV